ncbi:MAG: hypothetical protein OWU84_14755 [Firmicutes bacterium]|nr:hypothetical protein [Bacillota bacterium]
MADDPNVPQLEPTWSRRQFLGGVTGLGVSGFVAMFGRTALVAAARNFWRSPAAAGVIHLYALDYYYVPNYMTWRVGERLQVVFHNQSPTHWHEWTIGRPHPTREYVPPFGMLNGDGWVHDFWTGVQVTLSDPVGVDSFVPNQALVRYVGPRNRYRIATGGDFSPTLKPGGSLRLSFVVPDKPGTWHYGCFVQDAIHYRIGMRGILHVVR